MKNEVKSLFITGMVVALFAFPIAIIIAFPPTVIAYATLFSLVWSLLPDSWPILVPAVTAYLICVAMVGMVVWVFWFSAIREKNRPKLSVVKE